MKATMALDGRSNATNDPIVGISFQVADGTALLDNGHELRNAAITSRRRRSTKNVIFI